MGVGCSGACIYTADDLTWGGWRQGIARGAKQYSTIKYTINQSTTTAYPIVHETPCLAAYLLRPAPTTATDQCERILCFASDPADAPGWRRGDRCLFADDAFHGCGFLHQEAHPPPMRHGCSREGVCAWNTCVAHTHTQYNLSIPKTQNASTTTP